MEEYEKAIILIAREKIKILVKFPATDELVEDLETRLGVALPKSYKKMLGEFGILLFGGRMIYGIGKNGLEGDAAPNVVFATKDRRENGEITDQMVEVMPSGYGPYFVIDCAEMNDQAEAPVYEIDEAGYRHGKRRIADSFGEFLLGEVNDLLESA